MKYTKWKSSTFYNQGDKVLHQVKNLKEFYKIKKKNPTKT